MYNADDDRNFFDWVQRELRAVEKRLEEGRTCLAHLELALINVACDDPGAAVGTQLALPLLQERLDGRARAFAAQRAAAAQEAIIRAEARCACCRASPRSALVCTPRRECAARAASCAGGQYLCRGELCLMHHPARRGDITCVQE